MGGAVKGRAAGKTGRKCGEVMERERIEIGGSRAALVKVKGHNSGNNGSRGMGTEMKPHPVSGPGGRACEVKV